MRRRWKSMCAGSAFCLRKPGWITYRQRFPYRQSCHNLGSACRLPGRHDWSPLVQGLDYRGLRDQQQQVRRDFSGKYLDPDNDHYFTTKHVKSPTQMERDAVCRGQYHGWLKEKVGSHIIRRCNIHHCEQGGIIGRMGGVFSLIEDNHIHHINNMMELGGAEIAGIKDARCHRRDLPPQLHPPLHHGHLVRLEAQGTRITQNLFTTTSAPSLPNSWSGA